MEVTIAFRLLGGVDLSQQARPPMFKAINVTIAFRLLGGVEPYTLREMTAGYAQVTIAFRLLGGVEQMEDTEGEKVHD